MKIRSEKNYVIWENAIFEERKKSEQKMQKLRKLQKTFRARFFRLCLWWLMKFHEKKNENKTLLKSDKIVFKTSWKTSSCFFNDFLYDCKVWSDCIFSRTHTLKSLSAPLSVLWLTYTNDLNAFSRHFSLLYNQLTLTVKTQPVLFMFDLIS